LRFSIITLISLIIIEVADGLRDDFNNTVFNDPGGLSNDSNVSLFDDTVDDATKHVNAIIIFTPSSILK
jgi:hypothetical protein